MTKCYVQKKDVFDIDKVTVVGSPTITSDGVASGFSSENYIIAQPIINPINSLEVLCSFITPTDVMTFQFIETLNGGALSCAITNGRFRLRYNGDIFFDVVANTEYFVKIKHENNNCTLYYTTNKKDWITVNTKEKSLTSFNTLSIGGNSGVNPFQGSIDLSQFSITVDNELIYSPTKPIYLLERRKPKVWNKGQFTIVGNPSISESGVASGFSSSNYLTISQSIMNNVIGKPFKIEWEDILPTITTSPQYYVLGGDPWLEQRMVVGNINANGNFFVVVYDTNDTIHACYIASNVLNSLRGNKYKGIIEFNGTNTITLTMLFEDNQTYTASNTAEDNYTIKTFATPIKVGYKNEQSNIDLKSFKIYTDNNLVFDGGADTYVYDPSKFTVVGSPTITEYGVVSGFSSANYIEIQDVFSQSNNWVLETFTFVIDEFIQNEQYLLQMMGNCLTVSKAYSSSENFKIVFRLKTEDDTEVMYIYPNTFLQTGVNYQTKIEYTGLAYKFYVKEGNSDYVLIKEVNKSAKIIPTSNVIKIGSTSAGYAWANGSIDLPSFSITVDGKEVFTGAKEKFYAMRGGK